MSIAFLPSLALALLGAAEGAEHAEKFLGLPVWIWQITNLVAFFGVLLYFVARPMAEAFRRRQSEIEERRRETEKKRAAVDRLADEIRERTARVEREIEAIREQGRIDGEAVRAELAERAKEEAERIRRGSEEEIDRRIAAARAQLRQEASDLTAAAAVELIAREIRDEDRERLLADSVEQLKNAR